MQQAILEQSILDELHLFKLLSESLDRLFKDLTTFELRHHKQQLVIAELLLVNLNELAESLIERLQTSRGFSRSQRLL